MIEGGLECGLLTTGEAMVFLKIDWQEPETLLYHLADPDAEVSAHTDHFHLCTAVGQHLAFSLMALGRPGERQLHGQYERHQATQCLKTRVEDFETTLRSIPEEERSAPESSPGYEPEAYDGVDRSPYLFPRKRRQREEDEPVKEQTQRDPRESSDDEPTRDFPDTPSPTEQRTPRGGSEGEAIQGTQRGQRFPAQRSQGGRGGEGGSQKQDGPYCTQKCLLGLVNGGSLNPRYPDIAFHSNQPDGHRSNFHRPSYTCIQHPIDHPTLLGLPWEQLEGTLDDGITPLRQGNRLKGMQCINREWFTRMFDGQTCCLMSNSGESVMHSVVLSIINRFLTRPREKPSQRMGRIHTVERSLGQLRIAVVPGACGQECTFQHCRTLHHASFFACGRGKHRP